MAYQNWKNYETWNVVLWIANDESLYDFARRCVNYLSFAESISEVIPETPDSVKWLDESLDYPALNEFIWDL